jgi:serine/threonine protein kinase
MQLRASIAAGPRAEEATACYQASISSLVEKAHGYKCQLNPTRGFAWMNLIRIGQAIPRQGWKLHISISAYDAAKSIRLIGEALLDCEASFKIPNSLQGILLINSGQVGLSQLGKVFTIYPANPEHLRLISEAISCVSFSPGPFPLSDLAVENRLGQSIRYGAFSGTAPRWTPLGRPYTAVLDEAGNEVEDARAVDGSQCIAMSASPLSCALRLDPLSAGGEVVLNDELYLPIGIFSKGNRFRVDLAMQISRARTCILKRARPHVGEDVQGNCALRRLRNEFRSLQLIHGTKISPEVIAYDLDFGILVMTDLGGLSADNLDHTRRLKILPQIADALNALHAAGIVHRDIKLSNCIVRPNGRKVKLIDFELAASVGESAPIAGGTAGYIPTEGLASIAMPSYDIYSLGSCLAQWALQFDPSRLPLSSTRSRILKILLLGGRRRCAKVYATLTHPDPTCRPTALEAGKLLRSAGEGLAAENRRPLRISQRAHSIKRWASTIGHRVLPAMKAYERRTANGIAWRNNHLFADYCCRSLNIGSAGILLGLIHLVASSSGEKLLWDYIEGTAQNLLTATETHASGLFTGDCGVAVALAAAGRCLNDVRYCVKAKELLKVCISRQSNEWDLFSGAAGHLYGACCVSRILNDPSLILPLRPIVDSLLDSSAERDGVIHWKATSSYDADCRSFLGAAHGAAGVALGLATWAQLIGGHPHTELFAANVFQSIHAHGARVYGYNTAETLEGSERAPQYWCHGVAGFLWSVIQAFPANSSLLPTIEWGVECLRRATPVVDLASVCHGLSGILETWCMIGGWAARKGFESLRTEADATSARIARALRLTSQEISGACVWSAEDPGEITPDLWVGFLGPAVALSRFSSGDTTSMVSPDGISEALTTIQRENESQQSNSFRNR